MNFGKIPTSSFRFTLPLLLVWVLSVNNISAQHLGFKRYTVDEGLVQSEVTQIFQDSRGFLWLGTNFGVSQFDGNKFVSRFDSLGILKSPVLFIHEMPAGLVVVGSAAGIVIFYPHGSLSAFKYPSLPTGTNINSWVVDDRVFVSFSIKNYIRIFEATSKAVLDVTDSFRNLEALAERHNISKLIFDERYNCFYFTDNRQKIYSYFGNVVSDLHLPPNLGYTKGKDGFIYCMSAPGRAITKLPLGSVQTDFVSALVPGIINSISRLEGDKCSDILHFNSENPSLLNQFNVLENGKITIPDPASSSILFFEKGKSLVARLEIDRLISSYTDDEGTLWLGTANGLIHVFPEYFINFSGAEGLFPNTQSLVCDSKGVLWAGSYSDGLQYFQNNRFVKKLIPGLSDKTSVLNFYPGSGKDHQGVVHFCVNPYFSVSWDGEKMITDKKWPMTSTLFFYDDTATGTYYYGSGLGLVEKKYSEEIFTLHPTVYAGNHDAGSVVSILRSQKSELLLGGFKSLAAYNGKTFKLLPGKGLPEIPGANAMVKDSKGNIWIGNGSGLYFYNNEKFSKIRNGFFNSLVLSLQYVEPGRLLIGSIRGIGILNLEKFYKTAEVNIRYFDKSNGFVGGECQQNCITRTKDGFYWIGTSNGIVRLDASAISNEIKAPRVYLTNVFLYDERLNWKPISSIDLGNGELALSYEHNDIRFEFTGISFSAPDNIKFSYKLEGFDKNWSDASIDRNVVYTNLTQGIYTFKIRAYNDSGVWSETIAQYKIRVMGAFWQTWYFNLFLIIVIIVLSIIGVSHYQARRTRKQNQRLIDERRFAELQFRTLRNQLAPHFVFNALNAIGSSIYQNDKEQSYDFLQRFSRLIRSTLVHADKSYRKLNEEIEFVRNYLELEKFRFEDKFEYKIIIQDGIIPEIQVPKMIIQTFAENAVKHGLVQKSGKGLLRVLISSVPDYLIITVEDNGIGRKESLKNNTDSTGKGMEIMRDFIDLFNRFNEKNIEFEINDLLDDSGYIAGTRVIVKLPVEFTYKPINTIK